MPLRSTDARQRRGCGITATAGRLADRSVSRLHLLLQCSGATGGRLDWSPRHVAATGGRPAGRNMITLSVWLATVSNAPDGEGQRMSSPRSGPQGRECEDDNRAVARQPGIKPLRNISE